MKKSKNTSNVNESGQMVSKNNLHPNILEAIAEGIVVIGFNRRIIYINKMARNLIGYHDEIPEGAMCSDIIKTDLCSRDCPLDSRKDENICTSHFININLYQDNQSTLPLCLNVAPLADNDGNVIGIIENFRPMSEAIRVIESLEKSNVILSQEKNRIDSIINSLADGVFTINDDLIITSFNNGMEKLTGYSESEVIGRPCREILSSENCSVDCPLSNTLINGYGLANISERIKTRNAQSIPVFISTAFLREGNEEKGLIATVRDASEIEILRKEIYERYHFSDIIGKSKSLQQIFELIETLSDTDCAVLIEGESGTGKELVARAIHHESERKDKPFIKVNCSAIVEGLFESELFGHVKGSFTGAIKDKTGKFELADGGTIFLDEIGEMPLALQPKLLRVLQDMEFEKVGDTKTKKVDVRIIAATNRDLKEEVKLNRFREDLYFRLCIVPVKMPPLRDRKEDIPLLVNHFLEKCALKTPKKSKITEITPEALSMLIDYDWPGNVRELENAVEHAYIRTKSNIIDTESLPHTIITPLKEEIADNVEEPAQITRNEIEKLYIMKLLKKYNGNKTRVARDLGLSRTTLWRRLKAHNLTVSD